MITTNSNVYTRRIDLFKMVDSGQADIIMHGCNCFCTMGSGVAKLVKEKYPEAYEADKATESGDRNKLGTYTYAQYTKNTSTSKGRRIYVINAYTQYDYGRDGKCRFEYEAFEKIMKDVDDKFRGRIIAMPWIGCGLAGGDKNKVREILNRTVKHCKVCICEI